MGLYRNWASVVRRKFMKSTPQKTIIVLHTSNAPEEDVKEEREKDESLDDFQKINNIESQLDKKELSKEDLAAIKIQAYFRRHLAKRAFRALRSLVKLQALVRGVCVRRQARVALHCMHTLVRLQVRVRARQLLSKSGHGDY